MLGCELLKFGVLAFEPLRLGAMTPRLRYSKGTKSMVELEIAVQDAAGALAAAAGGATRIELCTALRLGGLTPSQGLVEQALEATAGRGSFVHVLVRSRGGGFVYDESEVATMEREIQALRRSGVHGIVIGALDPNGGIDTRALARWVDAAAGLVVTFHRAIDACPDPAAQLGVLAAAGVRRVLSSGGAGRSIDGLAALTRMAACAPAGFEVMAGGGVRIQDLTVLQRAGVDAVHLSARVAMSTAGPSGPGGGHADWDATSMELVEQARAALS